MRDEVTEERRAPWRRTKVWVPLVLVLFAAGSVAFYYFSSKSEVEAELAAIKKRGFPTSPAELDNWYKRVPAASNAALVLQEAFLLHVDPPATNHPNEIAKELKVGEALSDELRAAAENHLKNNLETLEKIRVAAQFKEGRFPVDLTLGFNALLPHLAQMKRMAILMKWQVIYQSAQGHREEAVRGLEAGFAMARTLEEEPLFISSLVRIAMTALMLPAMERLVTEHQLTEPELRRLEEMIDRTIEGGRKSMLRGMAGERAIGLAAFEMSGRAFAQLGGGGAPSGAQDIGMNMLFDVRRALGMHNRDRMFYLERMGESEAAFSKDYPEMLQAGQEVSDRMEAGIQGHRFRYIISGMLLPALSKGAQKEALLAAQLRCAKAALAIERFRLKNGRLPEIKDLVPEYLSEWPGDTVDGAPIEYERQTRGYVLTSLGATGLKNQGKKTNFTDVSFSVLR